MGKVKRLRSGSLSLLTPFLRKNMNYIKSKIQFEGIHCWPSCPFEEVTFLKDPHRHIFSVIVKKEVKHLDRDTEFIILGRLILNFIKNSYPEYSKAANVINLGSTSCEMLAEKILKQFNLEEVEVWEDMENCGAVTK
jgi:hypothetical protein